MASTPDGGGYWLVGADGGVFAFGEPPIYGSLPGAHVSPAAPVVGMASHPDGAATGWSAPTAGCSPSETPRITVAPGCARKPGGAGRRDGLDTCRRRLLARRRRRRGVRLRRRRVLRLAPGCARKPGGAGRRSRDRQMIPHRAARYGSASISGGLLHGRGRDDRRHCRSGRPPSSKPSRWTSRRPEATDVGQLPVTACRRRSRNARSASLVAMARAAR